MNATITDSLIQIGFKQLFPFVDHFRLDVSASKAIHIKTSRMINRKDVIEDIEGHYTGIFCNQITFIDLANNVNVTKLFKTTEASVNYIKSLK